MTDRWQPLLIGPHRFTIESSKGHTNRLIREGKYGETSIDDLTIYIRDDLPPTLWNETLFHEMLHAILGISGMATRLGEQLEEEIVSAIAPMLTQATTRMEMAGVPR